MSFTVCITALDDGSYKVYAEKEEAAGEMGEEMGGMPPSPMAPSAPDAAPAAPAMPMGEDPEEANESSAQTVKTIKEALTIALNALKNEGEITDVNGQERDFQAGFQGGAV